MQKRVTMHLRNNRLLFVVVAILFFNLGSWAQASGAQNTAPANPTPAPTTPSQPQTQQSAPVQSSPTQPSPTQPASAQFDSIGSYATKPGSTCARTTTLLGPGTQSAGRWLRLSHARAGGHAPRHRG